MRKDNGARPLAWDNKLAGRAQAWANRLAETTSASDSLPKIQYPESREDQQKYLGGDIEDADADGMNVAVLQKLGTNQKVTFDDTRKMIGTWSNECKTYENCQEKPCPRTNRFTQMVWKDTELIGCGKSSVQNGSDLREYLVCSYSPSGNMVGEYEINVDGKC